MQKGSDHLQIIDVPVMLSDDTDERSISGDLSDTGISFSQFPFFLAFNH